MTISPDQIRRMFDRVAHRYDLVNSLISLGLHRRWRRCAAAAARLPAGGLALDVCAGTGDIAIALVRRGGRAVALDFAPEMIAVGRRKAASLGVRYVRADALLLPLPDHTFDAATIGFSLRNLASRARLFAELARVVKPGGRVVSLETSQPPNRLVRAIYRLYLAVMMSFAGAISDGSAYRHLAGTIASFPPAEVIADEMTAAGLGKVTFRRLVLGTVAMHVGIVKTAGVPCVPEETCGGRS